jgi:hypothetical protein
MRAISNRLAKLEALEPQNLSERARAWLGQRPPLTPEEEAAEPPVDPDAVDMSGWSGGLKRWLGID